MHLKSISDSRSTFPELSPVGSDFRAPPLASLSDECLHEETLLASAREKQATLTLLEFLAEVDERRLYSARGYSTLWEYVHQALGYSESQASERVSAMRLMRKFPEVKDKLERNELTLTATSKLASFVRREGCSSEKTVELLEKISDKPTREVEKILLSEQGVLVSKPDLLKPTGPETTRISFDADSEFLSLLRELKDLQGHPDWTMNERLKEALRTGIEARKKKHEPKRASSSLEPGPGSGSDSHPVSESMESKASTDLNPSPAEPSTEHSSPVLLAPEVKTDSTEPSGSRSRSRHGSRYLSIQIRADVIARSGHRCEFVDEQSGKRCECRFGLQFDHRIPYAKGGNSNPENIRHLCANHNRFEAIREFGQEKMRSFLRP